MEDLNEISIPFRDRSNTWLPTTESSPPHDIPYTVEESNEIASSQNCRPRRNVWGNKSYAELITQAISSSDQKRMTLAQIYEWMVKNVEYFSDKQRDASSAGWKNSIRHNLSLHSCFMKQPNETPGKSHWWVLNPIVKAARKSRGRPTHQSSPVETAERESVSQIPQTNIHPLHGKSELQNVPSTNYRRRTNSDVSSYKCPAREYVPNCLRTSSTKEMQKYHADEVVDMLLTALRLRRNSQSIPYETDTIKTCSCSTHRSPSQLQGTDKLVRLLVRAMSLEGSDNIYLESLEPVSDYTVSYSGSAELHPNVDSSTTPSTSRKRKYSKINTNCLGGWNVPSNISKTGPGNSNKHKNVSPAYAERLQHFNVVDTNFNSKSNESSVLLQPSLVSYTDHSSQHTSIEQELHVSNGENSVVPDGGYNTNTQRSSGQSYCTLKRGENEDSFDRRRSCSYSGVSSTQMLPEVSSPQDSLNSNMEFCLNNFDWEVDQFFEDNNTKGSESLLGQQRQPWLILEEIF